MGVLRPRPGCWTLRGAWALEPPPNRPPKLRHLHLIEEKNDVSSNNNNDIFIPSLFTEPEGDVLNREVDAFDISNVIYIKIKLIEIKINNINKQQYMTDLFNCENIRNERVSVAFFFLASLFFRKASVSSLSLSLLNTTISLTQIFSSSYGTSVI